MTVYFRHWGDPQDNDDNILEGLETLPTNGRVPSTDDWLVLDKDIYRVLTVVWCPERESGDLYPVVVLGGA